MAGFDGIITNRDGSKSYRCEFCCLLGVAFEHPIPSGVDQDRFAAQHRRDNHAYPPVGWREDEIEGLGLGVRKARALTDLETGLGAGSDPTSEHKTPSNRATRKGRTDA